MLELEWHVGAGGVEDCAKCHYEHADSDYITDLTKVPAHPERPVPLSGVHTPIRCVECHWAANTTGDCAFCHERFIEGTHEVGFSKECDLCHIQSVWDVDYDHDHEKAECIDCHGSDPDHALPGYLEWSQDDDCGDSHEVDVWLLPEFEHEVRGIDDRCELCHPASLDTVHAGRSASCSDCHLNTSWTPQIVDHFKIDPPCVRCHEEDRPAEHLSDRELAPLDCDGCHEPGVSWRRQVQHITHPQPCIQCHGDTPDLHVKAYAQDCQWCHITDQRDVFKPHPNQTAECTDCHFIEHEGGDPNHSVDAAHATECSSCHMAGEGWDASDIDHTPLGLDCYSCHETTHAAIGGWEVSCGECHDTRYWLPVKVDHDLFGQDCLACHVTIHPNGKDEFSSDCALCHGTDDWAVRTWDHHLVNETDIDCVNCHDDIHRGTLGIVCEECHTTDTWETEVINP